MIAQGQPFRAAESIALPALGTGVGGFPIERAAEVMVSQAVESAGQEASPRRVVFVLRSEEAAEAFRVALERRTIRR